MKNQVQSLLEDDHASLDQLLTEVEEQLSKSQTSRAFELLDLFWARLAMHIRGEHLHLFPALRDNAQQFSGKGRLPAFAEVEAALEVLHADHDFFMKELGDMMKIARATPVDAAVASDFLDRLSSIRKRLETHNQIEEQQVYLWPSLLFDETTVSELNDRLKHELENLPPRFTSD